jgi:hypothetical protein
MKKYAIAAAVVVILAIVLVARYVIAAPAKVAARSLAAINNLTVGKTTEAELLARVEFQTVPRTCYQAFCFYHVQTENRLLHALHLAPRRFFAYTVRVRDGMVINVSILVVQQGLIPILATQTQDLPAGCGPSPCVRRIRLPNQPVQSINIIFDNESDIRNHMTDAVQIACLSRLHGCDSYNELMPLTKQVNLEADAQERR